MGSQTAGITLPSIGLNASQASNAADIGALGDLDKPGFLASALGVVGKYAGPLVSLAGGVQSIFQAQKLQDEYVSQMRAVEDLTQKAIRQISTNQLAGLQLPLESYRLGAQENISAQQQMLSALQESDPRALAAGVGKISTAGTQASEEKRRDMEKDIFDLQKATADQQTVIDQSISDIYLKGATGAAKAASESERQKTAAVEGAIKSVGDVATGIYEQSDLYKETGVGDKVNQALDSGLISEEQAGPLMAHLVDGGTVEPFLEKNK
jgi:hypothetical protein